MACMELSDYLIKRLQMFNKDFTPKQKAFLNEKFSHLEAVLIKSSINSHLQDEKLSTSKNTHTIVGQLKAVGESVLKEDE